MDSLELTEAVDLPHTIARRRPPAHGTKIPTANPCIKPGVAATDQAELYPHWDDHAHTFLQHHRGGLNGNARRLNGNGRRSHNDAWFPDGNGATGQERHGANAQRDQDRK